MPGNVKNKVIELIEARDAGRILPWEELPGGIFGLHTAVREVSGTDSTVLVSRGREPNVAWIVASITDDPNYIFAAGVADDHETARLNAESALQAMNVSEPSTFCPVVDGPIVNVLNRYGLLEGSTFAKIKK